MKTGLTLGKFAPLHKGHQSLIELGLQETEKMHVLIYDWPQSTDIPLPVRAGWIRAIYPQVEVIEAWGGPTETGNSPDITHQHDAYIRSILGSRKITHFYSSEFYGEHVSKALGAIDRRIDPARVSIPISATTIRANPHAARTYLHPRVYRDLITWVVFLGAPSTGKTTLCEACSRHFQTVWMPEYGREYWQANQMERRLSLAQLEDIAHGHREREEKLVVEADKYFFIDTDASTTRTFAQDYHGCSTDVLDQLTSKTRTRYDLFFLCEDDIPYDDTWDRSGAIHRSEFQKRIKADLQQRKVPYISLRGTLEERLHTVQHTLSRFNKWTWTENRISGL